MVPKSGFPAIVMQVLFSFFHSKEKNIFLRPSWKACQFLFSPPPPQYTQGVESKHVLEMGTRRSWVALFRKSGWTGAVILQLASQA